MAENLSEERLATVLMSVGDHLVVPPEPDAEPVVGSQAPTAKPSRRLLVGVALVVIVAGTILLVPPARTAIAELLGIGSTRIEIDSDIESAEASLPSIVAGLTPISNSEATAILGTELPTMSETTLGTPDTIYRMPEGGVLLEWRAADATLWVQPEATEVDAIHTKLVGSSQDIEPVDGLGTGALFIDGAHILQTPHRRLAATSVLLWTDDGRGYRFESALPRADMIDSARTIGVDGPDE